MDALGQIAGKAGLLIASAKSHNKALIGADEEAKKKGTALAEIKKEMYNAEIQLASAESTLLQAESNFATVESQRLDIVGKITSLLQEVGD
jgi:hypothetical protein